MTFAKDLERDQVAALAAMSIAIFLIANDFTTVTVAIVAIEDDLNTTVNRAGWVIKGYAAIYGSMIITGGRLADRFGGRRVFLIGASVFGVLSALAGLAPTIGLLIPARALMGVGGALMWPSLIRMAFGVLPEDQGALASGLVIGVAGIGNAVGPIIGGLLTETIGWRWIFFLNVPLVLLSMVLVRRQVAETEAAGGPVSDYRGIAMIAGAVIVLLVALDRGTEIGFGHPLIVVLLSSGVLGLLAFAMAEERAGSSALLPGDLMADRQIAGAALSVVMVAAIYFSMLLYLPQFMQQVLGFSALQAGAGLFPMLLVSGLVSFATAPLYQRLGARAVVAVGVVALVVTMVGMSFVSAESSYWDIAIWMVLAGAGLGLFYTGITTAVVSDVHPDRAGLAGGIVYTASVAGGALGLGLNTAIVLTSAGLVDGIGMAFRVDAALGLVALVTVFVTVVGREPALAHTYRGRHHRHQG